MPTFGPSWLPSTTPSTTVPSASPSSSVSPTETCYWIEIEVVYDEFPAESSWELLRVDTIDDAIERKSYAAADGDTLFTESMCLQEGEYKFTIRDSQGDGICCDSGEGSYNVTSNGELVVLGGEFGYNETKTFSIPFVPASSAVPSLSQPPSPYVFPSMGHFSSMTP